jgi:hypothetical protein
MSTVLVLRTVDKDRKSYNDFEWPTSGPVECTDWKATQECGNGLHGLLWGQGDAGLMSKAHDAIWQVVEVVADVIVDLGNKVKFPRGTVIYSGARHGALKMVLLNKQRLDEIRASATTGYYAHSATTGNSARSATTGDSAHSATTGYSAHSATTGNSAHSATTGYSARSATTGDYAIAAALGIDSRVKAGNNGVIIGRYDEKKTSRPRILVGYVGEDGIEADTWYEVKVSAAGIAKWKAVKA